MRNLPPRIELSHPTPEAADVAKTEKTERLPSIDKLRNKWTRRFLGVCAVTTAVGADLFLGAVTGRMPISETFRALGLEGPAQVVALGGTALFAAALGPLSRQQDILHMTPDRLKEVVALGGEKLPGWRRSFASIFHPRYIGDGLVVEVGRLRHESVYPPNQKV